MTTVRCPKCSDQVTMPVGLSGEATVRCPLCQEQYRLSEITANLPPALIVVDAGPTPAGIAYSGFAGHAPEAAAGLAVEEEPGGIPGFAIERAPSVGPREGAPAARRTGRPPKKPKNALVEGIKIVGGGIAGLMIGQLILWWIPWDRFLPVKPERRDPLGLGPKIAQYVSFIVPEQFATKTKPQPVQDDQANADLKDERPPPKLKAKPKARDDDKPERNEDGTFKWPAAPDDDGAEPKAPANGKKSPGTTPKPAAKLKPKPAQEKPPELDLNIGKDEKSDDSAPADTGMGQDSGLDLSDTKLDLPDMKVEPLVPPPPALDLPPVTLPGVSKDTPAKVVNQPADQAEVTDEKPAKPDSPPARRLAAPVTSADAVGQSLVAAEEAARAWQEKDEPDAKGYQALSKAAESLAFADGPDVAAVDAARKMLGGLAGKPQSMTLITKAGPLWLNSEKRATKGVLLLGVVADVQKQGALYQTTLKLEEGGTVLLVSDKDPAAAYKKDAKILVLGGIVEDPAKNVAGFEGDAARIIWTGVSQIVP